MPTGQYGIVYLIQGTGNHDVQVNTAFDLIDKGLGGYLVKSVAGGSNVTLTAVEWQNRLFEFTGALTGNIAVIVPTTTRLFMAYNNTSGAFTLTVRTSAGSGVAVAQGSRVMLEGNGTDVFGLVGVTGPSSSVDSEVAIFNGTTGSVIKRATGSGLAKLASGVLSTVAAPTGVVVGDTDTQTLTNKRITPRIVPLDDATSITPAGDTADENTHVNTQATGTLTVNAPSGTPTDGQPLILRIKSTNAQTYSWNSIYRGSVSLALPTGSSGGSLTDYLGFRYNSADIKWDLLATNGGFA